MYVPSDKPMNANDFNRLMTKLQLEDDLEKKVREETEEMEFEENATPATDSDQQTSSSLLTKLAMQGKV